MAPLLTNEVTVLRVDVCCAVIAVAVNEEVWREILKSIFTDNPRRRSSQSTKTETNWYETPILSAIEA